MPISTNFEISNFVTGSYVSQNSDDIVLCDCRFEQTMCQIKLLLFFTSFFQKFINTGYSKFIYMYINLLIQQYTNIWIGQYHKVDKNGIFDI